MSVCVFVAVYCVCVYVIKEKSVCVCVFVTSRGLLVSVNTVGSQLIHLACLWAKLQAAQTVCRAYSQGRVHKEKQIGRRGGGRLGMQRVCVCLCACVLGTTC